MKVVLFGLAAVVVGVGVGVGTAYLRVGSTASDPATLIEGARGVRPPPNPDEPQPKLAMDETDFDFGVMDDDATMRHKFVFRNEGPGTLTLTKGDTTCRCTVVDLRETQVAPGKSAAITLEWNSKNQAGPYRQSATVYTNDPGRPRVTLTISGQVRAALRLTPTDLVFSNVSVGEAASGDVKVLSYIAEDLQITGNDWEEKESADKFEVTWRPLSSDELAGEPGAKCGFLVHVTVKPGLPLGAFRQKILLRTNSKESPKVEVPVEGTVGSDISIFGPGWNDKNGVLTLESISRLEETERRLMLRCRGPYSQEVRYKVVLVEPSELHVELGERTPVQEGASSITPLTVRVPRGTQPLNYLGGEWGRLGRITLETNHPQAPQLRLLVRFAVVE